jgi:hypothetical protein
MSTRKTIRSIHYSAAAAFAASPSPLAFSRGSLEDEREVHLDIVRQFPQKLAGDPFMIK